MTASKYLKHQFWRELLVQFHTPKLLIDAALFFLMVMAFFPLTMPLDPSLLRQVAPGIIWLALLLTIMFACERVFQQDDDDGLIEQWLISSPSLRVLIVAKLLSRWVFILIPLLIISPILALLFNLSCYELAILAITFIITTPILICLSVMAAAFSSGIEQKGIIMALIILPLVVPVLIFASGALTAAMQHESVSGYLALLLALSLFASTLLPATIAAIIQISHTG